MGQSYTLHICVKVKNERHIIYTCLNYGMNLTVSNKTLEFQQNLK